MDEEPAWTLRDVAADEEDREPEDRSGAEREPPPDVPGEQGGVEEEQRRDGSDRRSHPIAAVDDQVDTAPDAGGDQLVDCRVDRRVLAADAGTGEEASGEEVPGGEGERRGHGRG